MKITEKVASLVAPKIGELGFELYDVEFNKEYGSWELLIFIDSPSGVTLDDCERVSTAIDPIIEEADPIEQAYFLTVSSVGIDRPLKLSKDFDRSIGSKIDVKLYTAPSDKALGKNNQPVMDEVATLAELGFKDGDTMIVVSKPSGAR